MGFQIKLMSLLLVFFQSIWAVETVQHVDLARYMGQWFEIASIPAKFQKKCAKNVTAVYSLLKNGKVSVTNSCEKEDGSYQVAQGLAKVKNKVTNAELGVSFVPILNRFGWFEGQYKILAIDENYEYVLVGEDKNKYGWILSRSPKLEIEHIVELEREIRRQGYDSCEFMTTVQNGGDFAQREPLCQVVKK